MIKKITAISMISLKSYYVRTTNGINLILFPSLMITIFILQSKYHTNIQELDLLIHALVLINVYSTVTILGNTIAYDRFYLRIKLYQASHLNYYYYLTGMLIPSILSGLVSQFVLIFIYNIFFEISILQVNLLQFTLFSVICSLSLSFIGTTIGFFAKDLVTAHSLSNLSTALLAFGGGIFFPIENFPFVFLRNFAHFLPTWFMARIYDGVFHSGIMYSKHFKVIDSNYFDLGILTFFSIYLLYSKNRWLKN